MVNMGPVPRALDMELLMDGDSLGRFLGDGIIVSTPTGATQCPQRASAGATPSVDASDAAIVDAVLSLSSHFGLQAIAEGVANSSE